MTPLVRRFIKTALSFLALGVLLGAYMLMRREFAGVWPGPYLVSAHTHAVFLGFVMFMIVGVSLWIFPKPLRGDPRYREGRVEAVYWLLLGGTVARFGGETARAFGDHALLPWLVGIGGLAQVVGLLLYAWTMWYRIRPSKRQLREMRGDPGE